MAKAYRFGRVLPLAAAGFILSLAMTFAQHQPDPLSSGQVEEVRELGDRPIDRIKLYLKYVNQRTSEIKELSTGSHENNRPAELRARFEEFTRLADELSENIDTYDGDHADIRKALRVIVDSSSKWDNILQGPPADRTYDFSRKTALIASDSVIEQTKKALTGEEAYFAAHKDEAGKNGIAPTPER